MDFLEGDYEILSEEGTDVIVFADFGRAGLKRAENKISQVDKSNLAAYGVLGSVRGISLVVRNTLALENATNLFLVGREIAPFFSFSAFMLLKQNGIDDKHDIIGFREYIKEKHNMYPLITQVDVSKEEVEEFNKYINVVWLNDLNKYQPTERKEVEQGRKRVARSMREKNRKYNFEKSKFKSRISDVMVGGSIYEETIEEAHKLALLKILYSGHETDSQYGKTKEIINLMITVKDPYPEVFGNMLYEDYGKDLVNPSLTSDTYTYGRLLTQYNGVNQIEEIIKRLRENLEDRAALASLWMPEIHLKQKTDQPCLDLVHVSVRNNKVNLTAYIRSNDIFKAWPVNVAGLAYVNYHIWNELKKDFKDLKLGYVTTISSSAHIYEGDWEDAKRKAQTYEKDFVQDKFGYFVISKDGEEYVAKIYENDGRLLGELKDRCHINLRKRIIRRFALTDEHASYVGEVLESLSKNIGDMDR